MVTKSSKATDSQEGDSQNLRADEVAAKTKLRPGYSVPPPKLPAIDVAIGDGGGDDTTAIATSIGNISDFIVASTVLRAPRTSSSAAGCPVGEGLWILELVTDDYPWETKWELYNGENDIVVAFGPPEGRNYERGTKYIGRICLPSGGYYMRWHDLGGDSICCDFGEGEWTVKANGEAVLRSDLAEDFGFQQKDYPFEVG